MTLSGEAPSAIATSTEYLPRGNIGKRKTKTPLTVSFGLAEVRGGVGLNVQVSYDAQLTGLLETRNRIKLLSPPSLRKPGNLESTYWDLQGGIYAGYKLSGNTELGIGYEMWQSLQPVVDNPKFKTYLNGSGFNAGVRLAF